MLLIFVGGPTGVKFRFFFLICVINHTCNLSRGYNVRLYVHTGLFVDVVGERRETVSFTRTVSFLTVSSKWNASIKTFMYMLVKYN